MAQGTALGLLAGTTGAMTLSLTFDQIQPGLLAITAAIPAVTGLLCGSVCRISRPVFHVSGKTPFTQSLVHLGSWCGLSAFLGNLGISRGFVHTVSVPEPEPIYIPKTEPARREFTPKSFENPNALVTALFYDIETNSLQADTIDRDRLASTRLALLSMDHTKQIPH
ncbi:MAG: hypothetical protein K2Q01_09480 [Rickettsiales bacterium]|nr:hypothetical protein [Rickettsiales bacterium]